MSWVFEAAIGGRTGETAEIGDGLSQAVLPWLNTCEGLRTVDAYRPARDSARDPYIGEERPPCLLLVGDFSSEAHLRRALADPDAASLGRLAPSGMDITVTALRRTFYAPDPDGTMPSPVSYVVRYLRPADDEAKFVRDYVESHPPVEARFPRIRSVACYFSLADIAVPGLPAMDYLIGNEVAFDSVEDFNAAMQSPVRAELRAHFHQFTGHRGTSSHVLMMRERLIDRTAG